MHSAEVWSSAEIDVGGRCRILTVTVKNIERVDNHDDEDQEQITFRDCLTLISAVFEQYLMTDKY